MDAGGPDQPGLLNIGNMACKGLTGMFRPSKGKASARGRSLLLSGCSSVWPERVPWAHEGAGSNPVTPTIGGNVQNLSLRKTTK